MGLLYNPFFAGIRSGMTKTKKIILPKETKRESLVSRNPADLDTRNLEITPLEDFGTMGLEDHKVDIKQWRLHLNGYVKTPLDLTYEQTMAVPWIEKEVLLICPGVFANHGRWRGISIKKLMEMAGWRKGATHVTIRGPKATYEKVERFPLTDILSEKVFLAYQVNDEVLPQNHGFPLRVVAEGHYGYEWVKYVEQVTVEKI